MNSGPGPWQRLAEAAVTIHAAQDGAAVAAAVTAAAEALAAGAATVTLGDAPAPPAAWAWPLHGRDGRGLGRLEVTPGPAAPADARPALAVLARMAAAALENVRRFEAAIAAEHYRTLFESNPQPMWVYDPATLAFLAVNDAAVRHYGYTRAEFARMTLLDIRPVEDRPGLRALLSRPLPPHTEPRPFRHCKKDGTVIEVEIASSGLTWADRPARLVLAQEVTERRRLEAQYRQAQKLEAIGRLAGGIAHDFNNLLTVINGFSQLVLQALSEADRARPLVAEIAKAGDRAAGLTRQLLAYSRKQILKPAVVDLNALITDLGQILGRLLGEDVTLQTALAPDLWRILADPGQIQQVILNLAVNARDAMPTGGLLRLATTNVHLDELTCRGRPELRPGAYVQLTVTDSGTGMTPEVKSRLFEPFFTTKPVGQGTGLGLATVYGIVKQSGGYVYVYSEEGQGTVFKIYLPRQADPVAVEPVPPPPAVAPGRETVLLVEDEPAVRGLAAHVLRAAGYTVLEAGDGVRALEAAHAHAGPLHLLVTDVVMPKLSGRQLADRLLVARPGLRVLFMSGFTEDMVIRHGVSEDGLDFLQKPFSPAVLAARVRELLDRAG